MCPHALDVTLCGNTVNNKALSSSRKYFWKNLFTPNVSKINYHMLINKFVLLKAYLHFIRISDFGFRISDANLLFSVRIRTFANRIRTYVSEINAFGCFVFIRTFPREPKAPGWNQPIKIQLPLTRDACRRFQLRLKDDDRAWLFQTIGYDY